MKQTTISLILGALALFIYWALAFANGKKVRTNDLLGFGMWCGAIITGGYMFFSASHLLHADEESYRFYVGIFGVVLMLWSFQTAYDMLKTVLAKKQQQSKASTQASNAEFKKPEDQKPNC